MTKDQQPYVLSAFNLVFGIKDTDIWVEALTSDFQYQIEVLNNNDDFIEYNIDDEDFSVVFNINRIDKDNNWNQHRMPFGVVSMNLKTFNISSFHDFN